MSHTTAFDILIASDEEYEFAEKYEPDAKTGRSTINKDQIKALHSAFDNYKGYKKYNPIEFNHLHIANVATNTQDI